MEAHLHDLLYHNKPPYLALQQTNENNQQHFIFKIPSGFILRLE